MKSITRRRSMLAVFGVVLLILILFFAWNFVINFFKLVMFSGAAAILLYPLCKHFENRFSKALSATLSISAAVVLIVITFSAIIFPLSVCFEAIYKSFNDILGNINLVSEFSDERISGHIATAVSSLMPKFGNLLFDLCGKLIGFAGTIADIAIAAVVAWYMLLSRTIIVLNLELCLPINKRDVLIRHIKNAYSEIMLYIRGQATIAICVGGLSVIALYFIDVPFSVPLGLIAGILNMIPYLGPIIACVPVSIVSLSDGLIPAVLAILALIAVQQIDGLILSPRIVGSATGFSPATVMLAVFAAGAAWGIPGMLLILPGLILIRTCVRVFVELGQSD